LLGKSLLVDLPDVYRQALMLYSTRNKIVHRGDVGEDDATQCFSLTSGDAWTALRCVASVFRWFGEPPVAFPDNSFVEFLRLDPGMQAR
jgi:hypothetical protein